MGYTSSRGLVEIYRSPAEAEIELVLGTTVRSIRLPARTFRGDQRHVVDLGAPRPPFDPDAGPSVYGLVSSEDRGPVAGAWVKLRARGSGQADGIGVAVSGADGSFRLTMPEPSHPSDGTPRPPETPASELTVSATGYLDHVEHHVAANVARGGAALGPPMEIVLRRDLRIAGTVRNTSPWRG